VTFTEIVPRRSRLALERGAPAPLGATPDEAGTNFAVWSRHATRMTLALFAPGGAPRAELALDPATHRTGDVWHAFVPGVRAGAEYGWRADSNLPGPEHAFEPDALLLDPCAKGVAGSERWGERRTGALRGVVCDLLYDWRGDRAPATPLAHTIIYETHVRAFTRHASSGVKHPGTFAGLAEKAGWLRSLGVTAVQIMPVAEFDETDNTPRRSGTRTPLLNVWGYMPLAFMAPKLSYAAEPTAAGALAGFRDMVRALHAAGLEVILDVVYNHTGEGSLRSRPRSWRGLDRASYFVLDAAGHDLDVTGCGHTFACARPAASELILEALRFWARDMHVDGFRFDLAATLTRDEQGDPQDDPALIRRLATDPALAHCKLIAEPWDFGLYQVGSFPEPERFSELNGRFRDDVRDWLRGVADAEKLSLRLAGSPDLYGAEGAGRSVSFVTSHDGFTLADLVSYERKHNEANGEENRDGGNDNRSWNCGAEGPSADAVVQALRRRQVRNAALLAILAPGPLLWLGGDEVLRTQGGNNNAWCQDGPEWWLDWDREHREQGFLSFVRTLLELRKKPGGFRTDLSQESGVLWRTPHDRLLALRFDGVGRAALLLLANGTEGEESCRLRRAGKSWRLLADTAAPPPRDFHPWQEAPRIDGAEIVVAARSLKLLARP